MKLASMSRIGKQPIKIPSGVEIKVDGQLVSVKGPKGELSQKLHEKVMVAQAEDELNVSVKHPENKTERSLWGLSQRLIQNMVEGVTQGFQKQLEINGVGYKAVLSGKKLVLNLGYSHPIEFEAPTGIDLTVEKNLITVTGTDKQLVGQVTANIRSFRKPEPYKGKGIKYVDETIQRKAGKAAAKSGA